MCSPEELQKLLNDENLFKQYIILKIDRMNEKLDESECHAQDIRRLSKKVEILSERIDKLDKDISFFKKLTVALLTAIAGLLGINLGIV